MVLSGFGDDGDAGEDGSVVAHDRRVRDATHGGRAVLAPDRQVADELHPLAHGRLDLRRHRCLGGWGEQRRELRPQGLVPGPAQQLLGVPVPAGDDAVGVHRDDADPGLVEQERIEREGPRVRTG